MFPSPPEHFLGKTASGLPLIMDRSCNVHQFVSKTKEKTKEFHKYWIWGLEKFQCFERVTHTAGTVCQALNCTECTDSSLSQFPCCVPSHFLHYHSWIVEIAIMVSSPDAVLSGKCSVVLRNTFPGCSDRISCGHWNPAFHGVPGTLTKGNALWFLQRTSITLWF